MIRKIKLSTFLCAIALMLTTATAQNVFAAMWQRIDEFISKDGKHVQHLALYENGQFKYKTVWVEADGTIHSKEGLDSNPIKDPNDNNNSPSAPIGVIITPGFGEVLLQSNQPVNSQIIDHSTGGIVGTTTINGNGSISTGTLEAGKTYSIISTNNVGEATSNTFMLNNDKQIWIGK